MFQFPGLASYGLYIHPQMTPSGCPVTTGFPIRKSPDQSSFDSSPGLIAAYHVLHRLSTPRHPPCTLNSLTALMRGCQPKHQRRCAELRRPTCDAGQTNHFRHFENPADTSPSKRQKKRLPAVCRLELMVLCHNTARPASNTSPIQ